VAPIPAFALSGEDGAGQVDAGPAALSVSSSLGSCGVVDTGVACQINISFNSLPNATSYTATITSPDGSVTDLGGVGPGGSSAWVPYVGAGTYAVQVTAYGTPLDPSEDSDGEPEVIATGISPPQSGNAEPRTAPDRTNEAEAGAAGNSAGESDGADGEANAEVGGAAEPAPTCEPVPVEPAPEPVAPAPETTTPAPPTGTTGPTDPAQADPGAASERGVADAATSVGANATVTPPLSESSGTGC
jgi:hypothetical protein